MKRAIVGLFTVLLLFAAVASQAHDFNGEHLEYEFGWKGIPVAEAVVNINNRDCDGPCYRGTIDLQSKKYLDLIWKVRDRFEMSCVKKDYSPRHFLFKQREGRFELDTEIRLDKDAGLLKSTRYRVDKNKPYRSKKAPAKEMFCPLSALLYMRSRPLNVGDTESIQVFDGKRIHNLQWSVSGKEKVTIGLGQFDSLKVLPKITRSNEKDNESKVEKVRTVVLWISDDPSHTILKIESEVFVGSVYAELVKKN